MYIYLCFRTVPLKKTVWNVLAEGNISSSHDIALENNDDHANKSSDGLILKKKKISRKKKKKILGKV